MAKLYDFQVNTIDGEPQPLSDFEGNVVLVVNVASKCGLTPQYQGLESLYREYRDRGLVVLGLPCNQFMNQEPGTEDEIKAFCTTKYDVSFPLTSKIEVNGEDRHPLYQWLTGEESGFPGPIKWNFEKFLIGRRGEPLARYAPQTAPDDARLRDDIERALAAA
jgi:glutathione peroxidase